MSDNTVHVAEVVRHGDAIVVPDGMTIVEAISVLTRQDQYDNEWVTIEENIDAFPWDGAIALMKAMQERFGWASHDPTPGFWGDTPPAMKSVPVSHDKVAHVAWGQFGLAGIQGYVRTGVHREENRVLFQVRAEVRRKHESVIAELVERTRELVRSESIYKGKAIRLNFSDEDIAEPKFMDITGEYSPIFSEDLERAIAVNVFTPLRHSQQCRNAGIPLKRGILASGPYGTGKTLLAFTTAQVAVNNGWTFLYLENVADLPDALQFIRGYEPAVIFAEDVDRVTSGARGAGLDKILNTIDGIESKCQEVMVILTTNHLEDVHRAMLRPGRLDVVLNVQPPDAEATERLVRHYGRGLIASGQDLTSVGMKLCGQIPAVIREVVERAKLVSINRTGADAVEIISDDLDHAAKVMSEERSLLDPPDSGKRDSDDLRNAFDVIGSRLVEFSRD